MALQLDKGIAYLLCLARVWSPESILTAWLYPTIQSHFQRTTPVSGSHMLSDFGIM